MLYIFHREDGWYPITLENDDEATENAEANSGTLKVTDAEDRIVWMRQ